MKLGRPYSEIRPFIEAVKGPVATAAVTAAVLASPGGRREGAGRPADTVVTDDGEIVPNPRGNQGYDGNPESVRSSERGTGSAYLAAVDFPGVVIDGRRRTRSEGQRLLDAACRAAKQEVVASVLKITRQGVGRLTSGRSRPSLDLAARIELIFGIPASSWAKAPSTRKQPAVALVALSAAASAPSIDEFDPPPSAAESE